MLSITTLQIQGLHLKMQKILEKVGKIFPGPFSGN